MNGYDEHLISEAGGDGDVLDQIQRRVDAAEAKRAQSRRTPGPIFDAAMMLAIQASSADVPALLALVREQAQQIERVKALHVLHEDSGKCAECTVSPYSMHSVRWPCPTIAALEPTP